MLHIREVLEERFLHSSVFDNRRKPFDVLFHVRFVRNPYRLILILELPLIVLVHYVCSEYCYIFEKCVVRRFPYLLKKPFQLRTDSCIWRQAYLGTVCQVMFLRGETFCWDEKA